MLKTNLIGIKQTIKAHIHKDFEVYTAILMLHTQEIQLQYYKIQAIKKQTTAKIWRKSFGYNHYKKFCRAKFIM